MPSMEPWDLPNMNPSHLLFHAAPMLFCARSGPFDQGHQLTGLIIFNYIRNTQSAFFVMAKRDGPGDPRSLSTPNERVDFPLGTGQNARRSRQGKCLKDM